MKKVATLLLILLMLCSLCALTACDPGTFYFDEEYLSGIVSVELVNYDNHNQKNFFTWVPDQSAKLKPIDMSKLSVVETLNQDKISDFFETLYKCHILDKYYAYDSPAGLCLKLNYANGDFIIINCAGKRYAGYIGNFTADGNVGEFIGCFSSYYSFETLVNDYFQTQI